MLHIFLLKLLTELYENFSKFCLVMANGSCPFPHRKCLEHFVGTYHAQSGVSLSRESLSPNTRKEWDSSVMKKQQKWSEEKE